MNAAFLLAFIAQSAAAAAAVNCGSKASHHAVSTRCQAHHSHAHAHGRLETHGPVQAKAAADTDLGELTPLSSAVSRPDGLAASAALKREPASPVVSLPSLRLGGRAAGAKVSAGEPPFDRRRAAASVGGDRNALGDITRVIAGATPVISAPAAWSVLLLGLLGLLVIMPRPRVARVRSWAMAIPARAASRSGTRAGAIARIDPARYPRASGPQSHQGCFVRAAPRTRFGAHSNFKLNSDEIADN